MDYHLILLFIYAAMLVVSALVFRPYFENR